MGIPFYQPNIVTPTCDPAVLDQNFQNIQHTLDLVDKALDPVIDQNGVVRHPDISSFPIVTTLTISTDPLLVWDVDARLWVQINIDNLIVLFNQNIWLTIAGDSGSAEANTATDTFTIAGDTGVTTSISGDTMTITVATPTDITITNEDTDTTNFITFVNNATGDEIIHTNTNLTYNSNTNTFSTTNLTVTGTLIGGGFGGTGGGGLVWRSKSFIATDFTDAGTSKELTTTITLANGEAIQIAWLDLTEWFNDASDDSTDDALLTMGFGSGHAGEIMSSGLDISKFAANTIKNYAIIKGDSDTGEQTAPFAWDTNTTTQTIWIKIATANGGVMSDFDEGAFKVSFLVSTAP